MILEIESTMQGEEAKACARMIAGMYVTWAASEGVPVAGLEEDSKRGYFRLSVDDAPAELAFEHGVHRVVRRSPFDGEGRRHTSFVSVTVDGADRSALPVRNYVIDPYTLAKDARTGLEVQDVHEVLNGGLGAFLRQKGPADA